MITNTIQVGSRILFYLSHHDKCRFSRFASNQTGLGLWTGPDRKTGNRPSAPNHVLFSRQMPVDSHWTQTQPTDVSLCLRTTGRWRWLEEDQRYPDHPERFDSWYQVLCREGLTGRCYWEVERRGCVAIGVTYRGITRRGRGGDSWLGGNNKSWSLHCMMMVTLSGTTVVEQTSVSPPLAPPE